jgi:ABC-type nitrate/sulfonate/bicarbonate transport system permease component
VPAIAIAPILVAWLGFGLLPKIVLVALGCFFPIAISFSDGLANADTDCVKLLKTMGANSLQIYRHVKIPYALPSFFSGLRMAVSYSLVGAVISEWLGGNSGLGVYMTRVRKAFSYDKMFAVIILSVILTLLIVGIVSLLERAAMRYKYKK